jgi:hypothetical protein
MLLSSYVFLSAYQSPAFSTCANIILFIFKRSVSRQAIFKRTKRPLVVFIKEVVKFLLLKEMKSSCNCNNNGIFGKFKRVIVQDSTSLKFPNKLADIYTGSANQNPQKKIAMARIQVAIDLKNDKFVSFDLDRFTKTDQASLGDILADLKESDLLIRDLGYYGLKFFKQVIDLKAFFLSRYKCGTIIQSKDGIRLDINKLLKSKRIVDIDVLAGVEDKVPVRLVAIAVPPKIAAQRRRKFIQTSKRKNNGKKPKKENLFLMGFQIFLTNVPRNVWSVKDVAKAYSCRWRIENIFKVWKSVFKLQNISKTASKHQIEVIIYGKLIFTLCFHRQFWNKIQKYKWDGQVSIYKAAKFWYDNFLMFLFKPESYCYFQRNIKKYSKLLIYDKRTRRNFEEISVSTGLRI